MRFLSGLYLFFIVFLSFHEIQSGVVRREINNNNNTNINNDNSATRPPGTGGPQTSALQKTLQGFIEISEKIPFVGGLLKAVFQKVVFVIIQIELITNGAVARLLGGALPCEISLDHGFRCSGISKNGGITKLIVDDINSLPNLLVPIFAKQMLTFFIKGVLNPIIDVTFGGQTWRPS